MKIIGLDVGNKTIGVAICDALEISSRPIKTIRRKGEFEKDIEELQEIIKKENAEKIIVGLPLNMDGTHGEQAKLTEEFVEKAKELISLPFEFTDERLTTFAAEEYLLGKGIKKAKMKEVIDQEAAAIILQSYLNKTYQEKRRRELFENRNLDSQD